MGTHKRRFAASILISCTLLLFACNAPKAPTAEQPAIGVEATQPVDSTPTPTVPVVPEKLDACSLLTGDEVAPILGGAVQEQAAIGTGGCSYSLVSDDPTKMAQLALSAAQGEEAKALTILGIGFLAGFSGDQNISAEFEALNNELPTLSLTELVEKVGDLFQETSIAVTHIDEPGGTGLWLLYQTDSYSQGTLLVVRGEEYVSLTLIGGETFTPDRLTMLVDLVFDRLPQVFYNLDEDNDGSFSIELTGDEEGQSELSPTETTTPETATGLVWVTAPNAGEVYAIDPKTDDVIATIDVGRFPRDIAVASGSVWVLSDTEGTVWRIDPATFEVVQTLPFNMSTRNIDVGSEMLWVTGSKGVRLIELDSGLRSDIVSNPCYDVAIGEGAIWVSQSQDNQLLQIDPSSRKVVATVKLEGQPNGIVYGHGLIWTVLGDTKELAAIDPSSGQVVHLEPFRYVLHGMAVGPDALWFTDPMALFSIKPGTWETGAISTSKPPVGITYYAGSLWVTTGEEGTVIRYNPLTGKAQAVIQIGSDPVGIAGGG